MRTEKQAQKDLETATDAARHVTIVTGTRLRKDSLQVIGEVSTVAALDAVYAAMDDQGGIALDVTDVYGRPALYVKLRHEVERGKQADTMATHAVAVKRAADRKHKRTSASYDPRPTMAGRSTYYGTARRPWPCMARKSRAPVAKLEPMFVAERKGRAFEPGDVERWGEYHGAQTYRP
jgi:hypothetical protein